MREFERRQTRRSCIEEEKRTSRKQQTAKKILEKGTERRGWTEEKEETIFLEGKRFRSSLLEVVVVESTRDRVVTHFFYDHERVCVCIIESHV